MKQMKKVEFIIEAVYVNRLIELFKHHGIFGYTVIKDIEGAGGHGLRTADDVMLLLGEKQRRERINLKYSGSIN